MLKLNLGAGEDKRKDFTNLDIRALPGIDVVCNACDLTQHYQNDTVDYIVAQHLLEYIPRARLAFALLEWRRVLKKDGTLEIRVLDLSEVMKALYLNDVSKEMGLHHEMVLAFLYGSQVTQYDVKLNGFTSEFLQGVLTGLGFEIKHTTKENYDVIVTAAKT